MAKYEGCISWLLVLLFFGGLFLMVAGK